eukprot:1189969-Prorocentrum_minimum.AAC.2
MKYLESQDGSGVLSTSLLLFAQEDPVAVAKKGEKKTKATDEGPDKVAGGAVREATNRRQDARIYSHDGPIGGRMRGYILMTDQSEAGRAGIFS